MKSESEKQVDLVRGVSKKVVLTIASMELGRKQSIYKKYQMSVSRLSLSSPRATGIEIDTNESVL